MSLPLICQRKLNIILTYRLYDPIKCLSILRFMSFIAHFYIDIPILLNLCPMICYQVLLDGFINIYSFLKIYNVKLWFNFSPCASHISTKES